MINRDTVEDFCSDEDLMRAYLAGDDAAFRTLFERHSGRLLGLMLKSRVPEDVAKDLVQQSFLQLHRARFDFDQDMKLKPYLVTIAMNLMRGHHRRNKRGPSFVELDQAPSEVAETPVGTDRIEQGHRAKLLRSALAKLPDAQREVIELHWLDGLPMREVARRVGASLSAVKVRAHRGYGRLREMLEPDAWAI